MFVNVVAFFNWGKDVANSIDILAVSVTFDIHTVDSKIKSLIRDLHLPSASLRTCVCFLLADDNAWSAKGKQKSLGVFYASVKRRVNCSREDYKQFIKKYIPFVQNLLLMTYTLCNGSNWHYSLSQSGNNRIDHTIRHVLMHFWLSSSGRDTWY